MSNLTARLNHVVVERTKAHTCRTWTYTWTYTYLKLCVHGQVNCDMRLSRITDYRLSLIRNIFAGKMYSAICVQWADGHGLA